mmetsp:Transcript_27646/g.46276  ORF Transcript_27646/g.46276 Transcript_27646/m.46276 type:complete len:477 (+) Transcript_27646:108-1538(+)|eukprot:CAMPEP_0198200176 /NCGR_PEP_ID=MMETSP1445-20131203/3227_1 /TAXON_ID=36898 /ORGANISM="Pyramimonas sp., Strain CCMP2087" /LENGTH=476 /DNA_ID=CAMNT_0043870151 /DNA_START=100 /DNA_END=1530 /DNA_ORIENTATION=+
MSAILKNSRTVLRGASSASRLGAARCFGGSGTTFNANAGGIETGLFAKLILPDGKEASLPILHPSTGTDKFVNISTLHKQVGHYTYDPGFTCTASCASSITFIDGDEGILTYRGYPVDQLARKSCFLETSYLLLYGELPSASELDDFKSEVKKHMLLKKDLLDFFAHFPTGAHPMAQMTSVVAGLSAFYPVNLDVKNEDQHKEAAVRLIGKMPMITSMVYRNNLGLPVSYPHAELDYTGNFLRMMFENPMYPGGMNRIYSDEVYTVVQKAMDVFFILHADHEQNASTSTVRIAGSSQANPYACVSAGVASLWGPAHGGANEAVIDMLAQIGKKENVAEFVRKVKNKEDGVRLMGFGHRVYKNYDPRAKYFRELVQDVLKVMDVKDPSLEVAMELERIALTDDYFVQRKLYPNVDFYTGIMLRALGIPTNMFTCLFALSRTTGWISQWAEMVEEKGFRISRPRQIFIGAPERTYPGL